MRTVAVLGLVTACSFRIGAGGGGDGAPGGPDDGGAVDVLVDVPDGTSAFGDVDLMPALEEYAAAGNWTVGDVSIDTTALTTTVALPVDVTLTEGVQDNGGSVAILRLRDFKTDPATTIRVVGQRPLVIIADHDITIAGTIDVSARMEVAGAGGYAPGTGPGLGGNGAHIDPNDDGGGGGGGFGGPGGAGGVGGVASGGTPGATYPATILVGGGGGGTTAPNLSCTNVGGGGGGAILIYGKHKITVTGTIHTGGGGGSAGMLCPSPSMYASGGGGGAGGMIYLQTPDLKGTGLLAANGGGGGGAECATGTAGPGQNARPSRVNVALGGAGTMCGSAGGNGAIEGTAPSAVATAQYNGGGGGGGVGRVVVRAPDLDAILASPAVVTP